MAKKNQSKIRSQRKTKAESIKKRQIKNRLQKPRAKTKSS